MKQFRQERMADAKHEAQGGSIADWLHALPVQQQTTHGGAQGTSSPDGADGQTCPASFRETGISWETSS